MEKTGKTIDDAINSAILELGVSRDMAEIEILEAGTKGIFGVIGSKLAKVRATVLDDCEDRAREFLNNVFSKMNIKVKIEFKKMGDELKINLSGDDMGVLIGRRGETLDALQYLTKLVVNKGDCDYKKISLDTENYREKREETLVRLAKKLADRVVKYRKSVYLEPMNPYERKIIHSTLQDNKQVSTRSIGDEPNRKIVISLNNK